MQALVIELDAVFLVHFHEEDKAPAQYLPRGLHARLGHRENGLIELLEDQEQPKKLVWKESDLMT